MAEVSAAVADEQPCSDTGLDDTEQLTLDTADLDDIGDPSHVVIRDGFLENAAQLRQHFDQRFADPRTFEGRFVWDYWHIPGQYTLLRTPADAFFPPELYESLQDALLQYGERQLGCRAITPVWLSYYVEGCRQELHTDSPHGPWAFVLSLTQWQGRRFSGGETQLLRPEVLDWWSHYDGFGQERGSLVELVAPEFNRLTVFDPRIPHGVVPVHGVHDPREARIVLHGWFADPEPFYEGALEADVMTAPLSELMEKLLPELGALPEATGTLTVRFTIAGASGAVTALEWLSDTVVPRPGGEEPPGRVRVAILSTVSDFILSHRFPKSYAGDTHVTLPLLF